VPTVLVPKVALNVILSGQLFFRKPFECKVKGPAALPLKAIVPSSSVLGFVL
jgi:hypothetical protein